MRPAPGRECPASPPYSRGVDPAGSPVSTALTSTSPPSNRSSRIVGMLRFLLDVRHRCGVDVSTMDTDALLGLVHRPIVASRATVPPRNPVRASASNVSRQDRLLRPRGRYLMSRVRGVEGTNRRPAQRPRGRSLPRPGADAREARNRRRSAELVPVDGVELQLICNDRGAPRRRPGRDWSTGRCRRR